MPQTIKGADGQDVEVFTAEEIETKKTEAIEEFKKANPTNAEDVTKLQDELKVTKEKLEKLSGKDMNFEKLREIKEDLEKQLDEKIKGAVSQSQGDSAIAASIEAIAGGDKKQADLIKFHFDTTLKGVEAKTTEEYQKKLEQAVTLAGGNKARIPSFGSAAGGFVPRPVAQGGNASDLKPEVLDMAEKRFGISKEDAKKFDKQDFSHTE